MKKLFICCTLSLLSVSVSFAQNAKINLTVTDGKPFKGTALLHDPETPFNLKNGAESSISLTNQTGTTTLNISQPHYITLTFYYSKGQPKYGDDYVAYNLFVSPGDDLNLQIDLTKKENGLVAAGKGANNNRPGSNSFTDIFTDHGLRSEKSPYVVINAINKEQQADKKLLTAYITKYKPSAAFISANQSNVQYFAAAKYFFIQTASLDESYYTGAWQKVQDSIFAAVKLNNEAALLSSNYKTLIFDVVERKKDVLSWQEEKNPESFYKEWYATDAAAGKKIFAAERSNLFQEKIINKYFSGRVAEYLYSSIIKSNLSQQDFHNIEKLYAHFKERYPQSSYLAQYKDAINNYVEKSKLTLNDKMIFAPGNGSNLNTLKEVADLYKGKVVFVDMWGTWCGPCREKIEAKSELLRNHFKGKDVVFLFISNRDTDREAEWKKLVAYYQMEGNHILASMKLTRDIMTQMKVTGFPSYFIIQKDGTCKKTNEQYQYDLPAMEKEITAAL